MEITGLQIDNTNLNNYIAGLYKKRSSYFNIIEYNEYRETLLKYCSKKFNQEKRIVRLAPSIDYMYENFNNPEDVNNYETKGFEFDPKKFNGAWSGVTSNEIEIISGWEQGIKGQFNPVIIGNKPPVHFFGGGDTGQGKSVVTNTILHSLLEVYPPWELELYMSDMKMVEFGMYSGYNVPHIKTIAISEDIEFTVSMLQNFRDQMQKLQEIFSRLGVKNIPGFRSKYNLIIPRKIFYADEVQQLFTLAGKRIATLEKLVSQVAKLGRATGYHLGFVSQSVAGTVSKDVLNQFGAGFSVYCQGAETSEALIGNDGASLEREIGKLITNSGGQSKEDNVEIRVPFLDDEEDENGDSIFKRSMRNIEERVAEVGIDSNTFVYNQKNRTKYSPLLEKLSKIDNEVILLGDSTVEKKKGQSRYEKIIFNNVSREDLIVISKDLNQTAKFIKQFMLAITASPRESKSFLVSFNASINKMLDLEEGEHYLMKEEVEKFSDSEVFYTLNSILTTYRFIEKIDSLVEQLGESPTEILEYIRPEIMDLYEDDEEAVDEFIEELMEIYSANSDFDDRFDFEKTKQEKKYLFLAGLDMAVGIGRDNSFNYEDSLKRFIEDGPKYGMHTIAVSQGLGEASDYFKAFNHVVVYRTEYVVNAKFDIDMELPKDIKGISIYKNTEKGTELKFKNPIITVKRLDNNDSINLGV